MDEHSFIIKMVLTEAGMLLRKRAEEIVALYEKAENEWLNFSDSVNGEVYIGGGESYGMTILMDAVGKMLSDYPDIKIHLYSGDMLDVCERLDKGLIDFGLVMQPTDLSKYENIRLSYKDRWGVLMRKDHPLADREFITPADLSGVPLVQSRHSLPTGYLADWYAGTDGINVVGTYNLLRNATYFAEKNIGCVLCFDRLINTTGDSNLTFRPLSPPVEVELNVVWKKYQVFSKAAQLFLSVMKDSLSG